MKHFKNIKRLGLLTLSFTLAVSSLAIVPWQNASVSALNIGGIELPFDAGTAAKNLYLVRDASNAAIANPSKENKGADKNGPGTAKLSKSGMHGSSSYVDSDGNEQKLEFTHPDDKRRPAIIYVHGGGWRVDDGNYKADFRERAANHGFASFRVYYKLGPNRIYRSFNDIMNVVEHVRNNADTYNVDPGRLIMWGDSAGGSLTARIAASGKSGLAGAVCWSAPTNGVRDLFHSLPTALDGLDHSTCLNTQFTDIFTEVAELYRGQEYIFQDPSKILKLSPEEQIKLAETTAKALGMVKDKIPEGAEQFKVMLAEWGIDSSRLNNLYSIGRSSSNTLSEAANKLDPEKANKQTDVPANNSDLQEFKDSISRVSKDLDKISGDSELAKNVKSELDRILTDLPSEPGQTGNITLEEAKGQVQAISQSLKDSTDSKDPKNKNSMVYQLIQSTQKDPSKKAKTAITDNEAVRAWLSTLNGEQSTILTNFLGAMDAIGYNSELSDDQKTRLNDLRDSATLLSDSSKENSTQFASEMNGDSRDLLMNKLADCVDNIIHMSPAIFAHPNTPPMFMANGEHEPITPAADAYEMRDKVRSFGTRAEALILPGDIHMGYDERAVEPSFAFAKSITNPEPR